MEPVVDIYVPPRGTLHDHGDRHYCPTVSDVQWSDTTHGCSTASFTVLDPVTSARLTEDCRVWISDPSSGEVVWTGNIARDGLQLGPLGDSTTVRCVGNVRDLHSSYWSLPYLVTDYQAWEDEAIKYESHPNFNVGITTRPSLKFSINDNGKCYPGMEGRMAYMAHLGSSMHIGGFRGRFLAYLDRQYWLMKLHVGDQFWGNTPINRQWSTTPVTLDPRAGGSAEWPMPPKPSDLDPAEDPENYLVLVASWEPPDGTPGVTTERDYTYAVYDDAIEGPLTVFGQKVDRWGENVWTDTTRGVNADEVIEDVIGRCLTEHVDPGRVDIIHDARVLDTADWRDPVTPGDVLGDLNAFHPDYFWRIGLRSTTSGLAPFDWRAWDTTPRYIIDTSVAEVDLDGGPDELFNRVTVTWVDGKGRRKSKSYAAPIFDFPDIASLDGWREPEPMDLGESRESIADQVGPAWLSQVAVRKPAGSVTVYGPVLDTVTQTLVPPSQLEAATTLALSSDEPTQVYRVVEVSHRGTGEATLSIGKELLDLSVVVDRITGGGRR